MNSTFEKPNPAKVRKSLTTDDIPLIDRESPPTYVTFRSRMSKPHIHLGEAEGDIMRSDFKDFQQNMIGIMNTWFAKQDEKLSVIIKDFDEIKTSMKFISDKYDELEKKTEDNKNRTSTLEDKVVSLDCQLTEVQKLEIKIDAMEQNARQCNVEIFKIPEKRSENLVLIVQKIGELTKNPVLSQDLVSVHRVPHADKNSKLPKNIIVKFSSKAIRDNFIGAARKKKGLTLADLDISGAAPSQSIFINEHLTLKNKLLYKEVRETAKRCGYRYVWTQNGTILVRATGTSPIFAVRTKEEITKLIKLP